MAAITFKAGHQSERHPWEKFKTLLTAFREQLDAFVSYRMRLAASEAEHVRPRQGSPSVNTR
jgi:hypothetical protein